MKKPVWLKNRVLYEQEKTKNQERSTKNLIGFFRKNIPALTSFDGARALAEKFQGRAAAFEDLFQTLKKIAAPLTPQEQESLQIVVASIAKKLYHPPITYCKTRAQDRQDVRYYASLLREMFQLANKE